MRRQIPVHQQLYNHLFPHPSPIDPPSFTAHLAKNLVPEVRIEVATFYGDLNSVEARYPGLDYCYPPHRLRLGRFKHHRRLFKAFEVLGLTEQEIQDLCCWEGSKWARQKYEEDQGVKVMDTTGDEIGPWIDPRQMSAKERSKRPVSRKLLNARPIGICVTSKQDTVVTFTEHEPKSNLDHRMLPVYARFAGPGRVPAVRSRLQQLQDQIIQAWTDGHDIPADVEALVKDHVERGELPEDFFAYAQRMAEIRRLDARAGQS